MELRRLPTLDGLRGIAVLMVFLYHASNSHTPLMWTGVDLFFILSGYLITGVLLDLRERHRIGGGERTHAWNAWKTFYLRRARRILPPYAGFLIAASVVYPIAWPKLWYFYVFFNANLPVVLHRVTLKAMVPLWSLAVEEQFYLLWPLVVFHARPRLVKKVALAVIAIAPVLRAVCTLFVSTHEPIYFLAPFRVDTLAWGAYIAVARHENREWIRGHWLSAARWAGAAAVLVCAASASPRFRLTANSVIFNSAGYSLIAVIFAGALIYVLADRGGMVSAVLSSRPLRYMGLISYTFYLYHWCVLSFLSAHIHSQLAVAVLGFCVSGFIASLSWVAMEAPLLGVESGLGIRRPRRAPWNRHAAPAAYHIG